MWSEMQINESSGLVTLTVSGQVSYPGVIKTLAKMLEDPRFQKGADILWDFRSAELDRLTAADIRGITSFLEKKKESRGEGYKVAIVSERDADFGVGRMYEGYAGRLPFNVMVFRKMEEALQWLRK
jgi:hypothetical protein